MSGIYPCDIQVSSYKELTRVRNLTSGGTAGYFEGNLIPSVKTPVIID